MQLHHHHFLALHKVLPMESKVQAKQFYWCWKYHLEVLLHFVWMGNAFHKIVHPLKWMWNGFPDHIGCTLRYWLDNHQKYILCFLHPFCFLISSRLRQNTGIQKFLHDCIQELSNIVSHTEFSIQWQAMEVYWLNRLHGGHIGPRILGTHQIEISMPLIRLVYADASSLLWYFVVGFPHKSFGVQSLFHHNTLAN